MHPALERLVKRLANSSYYTKRLILLIFDTMLISAALWGAVALRLESVWPPLWRQFFWLFFALPFISYPVFIHLGLYRAVIRYTGVESLWIICKAAYFCFFLFAGLLLFHGIEGFPRSVPLIFFFLLFILIGGSRLFFRTLYFSACRKNVKSKRVLIYGAGASGSQMANAFKHSEEFRAVAFTDDNPRLQKRKLHGLPVLAPSGIEEYIQEGGVDMILLAMPSASKKRKREILKHLEPLPVEVKSLPPLNEMVSHAIGISAIQDIRIEDLLGRDPVPPRMDLIEACITDKNVLVTGAGGSIGSELCRQIAAARPRCLVLFEISEFALYSIESELRPLFGGSMRIIPILGSVGDKARMKAIMHAFKVDTVYHASAYKHVPLVEYNAIEGLRNNLFGTLIAAESAMETGVSMFVLISTDKAVRPTNIMGASKRMAELVLQAFAARGAKTRFTMVRFGNVLGSSGSVVPLFHKQIKAGGPLTVTHPDIVRYFMTIPEAVQLVLQAGAMGKGGDVFVLDMGEPVKIYDLARKMIRLHGLTVRDEKNPDGDVAIDFTGLRPGEKLFEELIVGKNVIGTEHPMIMRAKERFLPWNRLKEHLERLDQACASFDYESIRSLLEEIVDGYRPQCGIVDHVWISGVRDRALEGLRLHPQRFSGQRSEKGVITTLEEIRSRRDIGPQTSREDRES